MSAYSLIISDLHLSPARQDLCDAFEQYCRLRAADADCLYILGDLSDAWVGDDDDSETAELIRSTLSRLVNQGTAVKLMVGNRDFLMGEQLASDCGLTLLSDPSTEVVHNHKVLLLHGDSLCTDDAEYMAFREQIQNPANKALLLSQTLDARRDLAAQLRQQSQSANATKAEDIMDVNEDDVSSAFEAHEVVHMIHGHTHRPRIHEYDRSGQTARRYVLGDWDKVGWQIRIAASGIKLESFEL